jgi:Na+:H+ antiporter, NhaA family
VEPLFGGIVVRDVRRVPESSVPGHEDLGPELSQRPRACQSGHELAREFHSRPKTGELIGARLSEIARSDAEVSEGTLLETSLLAREAVSPLTRMESQLHPWSAYLILPVFALANAGVTVSLDGIADALTGRVGLGVALGLVVGAPLGGFLFAWLPVRFGPAPCPTGSTWRSLAPSPLKGIGFTVAIFITTLAFDDETLRAQATLAILIGSATAAVIGLAALYTRPKILASRRDAERAASRPARRPGRR